MAAFTVFCRDADGTGTTWISAIGAPDVETAKTRARNRCAEDWDCDAEDVSVVGVAAGDVTILEWED